MMEFIRRVPAGAVLTIEGLMRNVLPLNTMAIAMGLHVRVGIEDNLWGRKGERITSVQQIEQMVRIARELYREVATGEQAKADLPDRHALQDAPTRRWPSSATPRTASAGERGAPLRRAA